MHLCQIRHHAYECNVLRPYSFGNSEQGGHVERGKPAEEIRLRLYTISVQGSCVSAARSGCWWLTPAVK